MARPTVGPPPVPQSAVVPVEDRPGRKDLANYLEIAKAFERDDRRADLLAMFGGDQNLVDRFLAVALNAIATNSDLLLNASAVSIIQAVKDSATLGLEPTGLTGEAVIIRYGQTAQLAPMYRGYLKRIRNSGRVRDIDVQLVYDADEFDYGWNQNGGWFNHHPAKPTKGDDGAGTRGSYWGAYAYAVMPTGFVELEVMTEVEINYVRDRFSRAAQSDKGSPWDTSWGEMARKTVLRRLCKRLPQEAVDQLLLIDALADQAADQAKEAAVRVEASPARRAALRALGRGGTAAEPEAPLSASETGTEDEKPDEGAPPEDEAALDGPPDEAPMEI